MGNESSIVSRFSLHDLLVGLLAVNLGMARADSIVADAIRELSLIGDTWTLVDARRVLEHLTARGDDVAEAAQGALGRLSPLRAPTPHRTAGASANHGPVGERVTLQEVIALLTPALGVERATTVVTEAARKHGVRGDDADPRDLLRALDDLAARGGLLAVAARYAKAKLILRVRRHA